MERTFRRPLRRLRHELDRAHRALWRRRSPDLLAIEHPELGRHVLSNVVSLVTRPRLALDPGPTKDAAAVLWSDGLGWYARLKDASDVAIDPATPLRIDGHELAVRSVSISATGDVTVVDPNALTGPLFMRVRYDTVHIHRGDTTLILDGILAQIVSELATTSLPVGWDALAATIWRGEKDVAVLRRNWDASVARVRKKLRAANIRPNLLRTDGNGNFEIFLMPDDRVEDQT